MEIVSGKHDMNGKVALVTGALGGIGLATVQTFLREGAIVIATDYKETNRLEEKLNHRNLHTIDCDITDEQAVDSLINESVTKFGQFDVVVHCAGIYETTPDHELSLEAWKRMLDINLTGTFLVTNKAFQQMKGHGGKIVCLASNAGQTGGDLAGLHYAASKGGVIAYMKRLAKAGAKHHVYVNAIAPGPIQSEMIQGVPFDVDAFPLGRIGAPEDVAETALFLSSQSSNYITGQVIGVNGGLVI
ncbi:MAG TPA: SDR family oxidoreductase [Candidatus Pseudogracilibacillus intestinigallinarum]|uniref:SDR family oxidoreductase n=1 Tax=Candidatus Pseudogracilibacillus intestinigallinarum TaxID=2838742 RepID=A0A9D1PJE6_9BACI|nr:SDR family oxidoreductase [Candidatus Pseudogracilibacillus intestinigallinarum]